MDAYPSSDDAQYIQSGACADDDRERQTEREADAVFAEDRDTLIEVLRIELARFVETRGPLTDRADLALFLTRHGAFDSTDQYAQQFLDDYGLSAYLRAIAKALELGA